MDDLEETQELPLGCYDAGPETLRKEHVLHEDEDDHETCLPVHQRAFGCGDAMGTRALNSAASKFPLSRDE